MDADAGYAPLDPPVWVLQGLGPAGKAHLALGYGVAGTEAFVACGRVMYEPHVAEDHDDRCQACERSQERKQGPVIRPLPERVPPAPIKRRVPAWVTRQQARARLEEAEREARAEQVTPAVLAADLKRWAELLPRVILMGEMAAYNIERGETDRATAELEEAAASLRRRLAEVEAARSHLSTMNGIIPTPRRA